MNKEAIIRQRQRILDQLYDARLEETRFHKGYVSKSDLTDAIGEAGFNLGVLEELGHIERSGYRYRITARGVVACEQGVEK